MGHSKQFKETLKAQAYWFFLLPLFAEILVVKALGNRLVGGNLIHGIGFYFYDMVVPLLIPVGILVYRLNGIKPFRLSFSPRWVGANILLVFALAGWLFLFRGPTWKFPMAYAAGFLVLLYGVLFSALFLAIRPKEFPRARKKCR